MCFISFVLDFLRVSSGKPIGGIQDDEIRKCILTAEDLNKLLNDCPRRLLLLPFVGNRFSRHTGFPCLHAAAAGMDG